MENKPTNLKSTARVAGLLYLAIAITAAIGFMVIPESMMVPDDPKATAQNILDKEFLFRLSIFMTMLSQVAYVFLGLVLYRLFKGVSVSLSRSLLMIIFASVPVAFILIFYQFSALSILQDGPLAVFDQVQQYSLAYADMNMFRTGLVVIGIFWGLWLLPFGLLVIRSGFIPRILGYLLIIGGISYLVDVAAYTLFPPLQPGTNLLVAVTSSIAELAMVLWLLIKGVKE